MYSGPFFERQPFATAVFSGDCALPKNCRLQPAYFQALSHSSKFNGGYTPRFRFGTRYYAPSYSSAWDSGIWVQSWKWLDRKLRNCLVAFANFTHQSIRCTLEEVRQQAKACMRGVKEPSTK